MTVEWKISSKPVPYEEAVAFMEERVAQIRQGQASECVWLLEHPSIYTAGTSAKEEDLLNARFPVHETGRGGEFTYHGPGQRVIYVMLDLEKRGQKDLRLFIYNLERWVIDSLSHLGIVCERREGRVGLWVVDDEGAVLPCENKIAAIGVRVRKWVTYHGVAINVDPDLSHFEGIVPCGIRAYGVTSVRAEGLEASSSDLDDVLRTVFYDVFKSEGVL